MLLSINDLRGRSSQADIEILKMMVSNTLRKRTTCTLEDSVDMLSQKVWVDYKI